MFGFLLIMRISQTLFRMSTPSIRDEKRVGMPFSDILAYGLENFNLRVKVERS